jgi:hypothetical protein
MYNPKVWNDNIVIMADAAAISNRWKIEDITILPYRVSVQELMHRYDFLVTKVNAHRCDVDLILPATTAKGKRLIEMLDALRLVCSVLLSASSSITASSSRITEMQSKQSETLESTTRKAWILRNILSTGNCDEVLDHIEIDSRYSNDPFISVQIFYTTSTVIPSLGDGDGENDVVLEWKYDDVPVHDNDDESRIENDNTIIPISMMTRDELIQEENLLLQMASTPIPCSSTVPSSGVERANVRYVLCQEWGESQYTQVQSQLQSQNSDNSNCKNQIIDE